MPSISLTDIYLTDFELTPRVRDLKNIYFKAMPEICTERAELVTKFSLENGLFKKGRISILDKAKLYRHVLENRRPIVRHTLGLERGQNGMKNFKFKFKDTQLFAGSTTQKFKGVPLYPEFQALALWPELETISKRVRNPYHLDNEDKEKLNYHIFPHWINDNILELARERCELEALKTLGLGRTRPENKPMRLLEQLVFFLTSKMDCISHAIPNFCRAIKEGLREIIKDAKEEEDRVTDKSKQQFYAAISEVLEGLITYSNNLAKEAEKLAAAETDDQAKNELLEIADIHRKVPEKPAETFREALTTIWVCWTAIHLENPDIGLSLGRLDQVLYPLYQKDIERKSLTIESALELLCCLWLKIGDHVPMVPQAAEQLFGGGGSNQAITIGGVDREGKDAVNDLTYLILRSIELLKLRDPNLNARYYHKINRPEYLQRLCKANINTGATPAIHNDEAIIKALRAKGDPEERARDYGIVGCVEPVSSGTYGSCASILLNLASALELTLFNGRHRHTGLDLIISKETGDPTTFKSFDDDFKKAFEEQTRWLVEQATTLNNIFGKIHQDFYPTPVLSAFFEGPMDKGMDLIQGGANINSSGAAIIGLADVADSLTAIETVVFGNKDPIPFAKLLHALEKNFEGYEPLRRRLMDKTPKYGNEDPLVKDPVAEKNVRWLLELLDDVFGKKENYRGGHYRVGYWTMTIHAGFGRLMGATPNGRKEGESFASGITPVSGVTPWLVNARNAVASLPAKYISNGMAFNVKLFPEGEGMLDRLVRSVDQYFSNGGMEIQFNIISHRDLARAVEHPEEYPELLVRVSGYTAYFKDLNPEMQKEIIARTEFLLLPGKQRHPLIQLLKIRGQKVDKQIQPDSQAEGFSQPI